MKENIEYSKISYVDNLFTEDSRKIVVINGIHFVKEVSPSGYKNGKVLHSTRYYPCPVE